MFIPEKWRVGVGKFYLDCAEKLPPFGGGVVAMLQELRRHQRRDSNNAFTKSRFPENVTIELSYIRMAEIFLLEDTNRLKSGLSKLFPAIKSQTANSSLAGEISEFATGLSGGGWKTIGTIVREGKFRTPRTSSLLFQRIPDLPPEVDFIGVELHKCLSSSTYLTFDVYLTAEAKAHLLRLHNQTYLANVRFGNLVPWRLLFGGWSEDSAWSCATDAIAEWLETIRNKIETVLRKYFVGVFLGSTTIEKPRLRAIEVFLLKGAPTKPDEFNKWLNKHLGWWTSLGFNFQRDIFCDEERAYVWPSTRKARLTPTHRFIARESDGLAGVQTKDTLNGLVVGLTLVELLKLIEKNIEMFREQAFRKKSWRLKSSIRLNEKIQNEAMMLERIIMEFNQNKPWIEYSMAGMSDYKSLSLHIQDDLRTTLVKGIEYNARFLGEHLSFVKKQSDGYLATVNIAVMYRLQKRGLWIAIFGALFTAVAAPIAIVETYKQWDKVKECWHLIWHFLRNM